MATIKSFTDLQQSKKLAEILPIESADMIYIMYRNGEKPQNGDENLSTVYESNEHKWYWIDIIDEAWNMRIGEDVPCWSLAALLSVLPNPNLFESDGLWHIFCDNNLSYINGFDNPVDACVAIVEKLDELNLL